MTMEHRPYARYMYIYVGAYVGDMYIYVGAYVGAYQLACKHASHMQTWNIAARVSSPPPDWSPSRASAATQPPARTTRVRTWV